MSTDRYVNQRVAVDVELVTSDAMLLSATREFGMPVETLVLAGDRDGIRERLDHQHRRTRREPG